MKIQYVLLKVFTETEYIRGSFSTDHSIEMIREVEIFRKDTEEEIEAILDSAFILARQILDKEREYRSINITGTIFLAPTHRANALKEMQILESEIGKLKDDYRQMTGNGFSYSFNDHSEYRIVRVYSA